MKNDYRHGFITMHKKGYGKEGIFCITMHGNKMSFLNVCRFTFSQKNAESCGYKFIFLGYLQTSKKNTSHGSKSKRIKKH